MQAAAPEAPGPAAAPVLRLLGTPCIDLGAQLVPLSPKDAALLCLVALAGPLRAERVAALLWPAADAARADTSLRQRIHRLRRAAGVQLLERGPVLQLGDGVATDLPAALGRLAADEHAAVPPLLGDYSYDTLPDLADWVRTQRQHWQARCDDALAAAAAQCEKAGALVRALAYAQRLADAQPLAEHTQRRLMRLHYLRGDRAAAIAAFEGHERRLKDELGTRPSAETLELLATIERGGSSLPAQRQVVPASLLHPPQMVGRSTALRALQHAWAAGHAFLLLGEAGIGKSRLLHELAAVQPGLLCVQARSGEAGVPRALLVRVLRALLALHAPALTPEQQSHLALALPELGPAAAVSGDAQRVLLQRCLEQLLAHATGQGLQALCIDDLHHADAASIDCLQAASQASLPGPLRWGLAQRADGSSAALMAWHSALQEAGVLDTVQLQPLRADDLAILVATLAVPGLLPQQLAPALLQHTGGNPLFVLETLKELVLSGWPSEPGAVPRLPQPAGVGALVQQRLSRLTPAAQKLAQLAALAGAQFSVALAADVLAAHPLDLAEAWRELEASQVLRGAALAHDLIGDAARAAVPLPIAQWLHRRVAQHLVAAGTEPASVALHWAGAGAFLEAGHAHAAAARQAQAASQRVHEVEHWEQAATAFDQAAQPALAFEARCDSVTACIVVHGVARAQALIDQLLAAAATPGQRAAALLARATACLMAGEHVAGVRAAEEASALAADLPLPWTACDAACLQAVGMVQGGRPADALAVIEPWHTVVDQDGSPAQRGRYFANLAYVLNGARRLRDTAVALGQAIAHAQAQGDLAELATLTSNLATVHGNLGHAGQALALARQAWALQAQLGNTQGPTGAVVQTYLGLYCGLRGLYGEALDHLDAALAVFQRDSQPLWLAVAANHKAQLLLELGQFARAGQALALATPPVDHVRARSATIAARLARALGQPWRPALQQALALLAQGGDPHVRMHAQLDDAVRRSEDGADDALAAFDAVLQTARQLEFAAVATKAGLLRARAQSLAGDVQGAADAVRPLVQALHSVQPSDMDMGQAWWLAAQVLQAAGDAAQAQAALLHGVRWVRDTALPQVPPPFRDSFLQRNPANRALLAAAGVAVTAQ
jgi:DNA-binding SARP family transcriptional activator